MLQDRDEWGKDILKCALKTKVIGHEVFFFQETDSTNIQAKLLSDQGAADGTLVVANVQTAGKGRRGRNWESNQEGGIYMSLLLRPQILPECASMLTLVAALSVSQGIQQLLDLQPQIKWPNDLVLNNKKICGILTEMSADISGIKHIVVGIGINVNNDQFSDEIINTATALSIETKGHISRAELTNACLVAWEHNYNIFLKTSNLKELVLDYNANLINRNNKVKVLDPKGAYVAIAKGIDESGALIVTDDQGIEKKISSGEVSVRGLYGYV